MAIDEVPVEDRAFHVEQHGIDFIPLAERWATPRAVAGLWAGASVNIEYVVYGAILMTFGFSFAEAVVIIVVGNLSWLLVGIASLQGPQAGTTVFGINRAPFGPRGSKAIALCNWLTMLGFETEGLILIVGAGLVLAAKAGLAESTPLKVAMILVAVGIQVLLPFFGHATMARVLRWLIVPFVVIYAVLGGFAVGHAHLDAPAAPWVTWQLWTAGLAFTIALSGLGWTENGNDYSRYLPPQASRRGIVGWLFVGTALPEIALMVLGAAAFTFVGSDGTWNGANPFSAFLDQHVMPGWFVVVLMLFVVAQLFSINSLDLYSSGVTLQALGARVRRYQAVLIDSAICCAITFYAVFNSQFSTLLKDFVAIVIVWIAPWCGIFLTDWLLRAKRYDPMGLQDVTSSSPYWGTSGIHWPAIGAQVLGGVAAIVALDATFLPTWVRPLSVHSGGADFSIFLGFAVGAGVYALLAGPALRASSRQLPAGAIS